MTMVRSCFPAFLVSALVLIACGSYLPESQSGTRVQTSYLSLDQRPARGGTASILPAPVSSRTLIGPNTTADVVVAALSAEEEPGDPSALIAGGAVGTSAAGYAIGMAGAISLGTAMVLVGPLMLPLAIEEANIAADQRTITRSVDGYGFPKSLEEKLTRVLDRTGSKGLAGAAEVFHVELSLENYGFASEGSNLVRCFTFKGTLQVRDNVRVHYQEPIFWNTRRRSEDLPPVRCATLDEMARQDGALAKDILKEATIILSAAVLRRISGKSP